MTMFCMLRGRDVLKKIRKKYVVLCMMCTIFLIGCKKIDTEEACAETNGTTVSNEVMEQRVELPQEMSGEISQDDICIGNLKLNNEVVQYTALRKYETLDYIINIKDCDDRVLQILEYSYDLKGDIPVLHGIYPKDVNQDGYEDILIQLGGHGNIGPVWACYVYDKSEEQFVYIEGFEDLLGLEINKEIRSVYYEGGGSYYRLERYIIHNNELLLEGRLTQELNEQDSEYYILCTEEHYEEGKLVYVNKEISVDEIDMDFWHQDIGEGLKI